MKTIILLILSAFTAFAATTYPVLTDNPLRTFSGGGTNLALLNGTNRFTGPLQLPGITSTRVPIIDAGGNLTNSAVTSAELANLSGVTGGVQTNIAARVPLAGGTMTGALTVPSADGAGLKFSGGGTIEDYSNYLVFTSPYTGFKFFSPQVGTNVLTTDNTAATFELNFTLSSSKTFGWSGTGCSMAGASDLAASAYGAFTFTTTGGSTRLAAAVENSGALKSYGSHSGAGANYVRASLSASTTVVTLAAETAGTGDDNIQINLTPAGTSGVVIGSGSAAITKVLTATATLNFDLTAVVVEDLTMTVTGAVSGDIVSLGVPSGSVTATVQYTGWVSAADTVTIRARTSGAGENPSSGTFRATVIKH